MPLLTTREVAQELGIRVTRVYDLIDSGVLPSVGLGRQIRVDADQLRAWIASGGKRLPGGWKREASAR